MDVQRVRLFDVSPDKHQNTAKSCDYTSRRDKQLIVCSIYKVWIIYRSMSSDFWAGYLSGAIGIIIGNPLDLIKVRLQAGSNNAYARAGSTRSYVSQFESASSLVRGSPTQTKKCAVQYSS